MLAKFYSLLVSAECLIWEVSVTLVIAPNHPCNCSANAESLIKQAKAEKIRLPGAFLQKHSDKTQTKPDQNKSTPQCSEMTKQASKQVIEQQSKSCYLALLCLQLKYLSLPGTKAG